VIVFNYKIKEGKNKMKRLNKKGFTLIELLAVIIILGILMIIAIPSVTSYIQNSRKSAYVDTAVAYTDAVMKEVNAGKNFRLYSTDTLYMIPVGHEAGKSCVTVESGGQSPFSDTWKYAYVGVTYSGKGYSYYFIGEDGAGQGVSMIDKKELTDNGTDYIYSTHVASNGAAEPTNSSNPVTMSDAFSAKLKGYYAGQANQTHTIDTDETNVLVNFVTSKETGKEIHNIIYVGSGACSQAEGATANPTPTTSG
jgi:type IV pilus assembly protein PilA